MARAVALSDLKRFPSYSNPFASTVTSMCSPLYTRVRIEPGCGRRGSVTSGIVSSTMSSVLGIPFALFVLGAVVRMSASRASSSARCRASSDNPPNACDCNLHAMRLMRYALLLDGLVRQTPQGVVCGGWRPSCVSMQRFVFRCSRCSSFLYSCPWM